MRPAYEALFPPDSRPFQEKIDNHVHMVALYTCWYNFARINSAIRMSPAMAAGLETRLWDISDIVNLIESHEMQAAP